MALAGDDVRALALAKAKDNGPRDSRRMGLAKEGQIAEGSAAWEDMSAGDQAKRKRAAGAQGAEVAGRREAAPRCRRARRAPGAACQSTGLNGMLLFLPSPLLPCPQRRSNWSCLQPCIGLNILYA